MAETHQEVVKVWIAPGCIVCDACETDCPEVFEVQEETCIVRPDAGSSDFTKPLTPSIITAAEGCPVDVIKFEMVEVEGPEPWVGQETRTVEGAAAGTATHVAKPARVIPDGPPAPKWSGLLSDSKISHRGRSEIEVDARQAPPAKAPAEAVAAALPDNAPPDARAAAMIGSGFARPRASLAERIRRRSTVSRREFATMSGAGVILAIGWGSLAFVGATFAAALQSFMVPKLIKEPPSVFRAGRSSDFPDFGVFENFKASQGVWLIRLTGGKLIALSTTCTHLGCIPNWLSNDSKFKCPCHGSGFTMEGMNFEGPAPRPLERLKIYHEGEFIMVDKSKKYRFELGQWDANGSYIDV